MPDTEKCYICEYARFIENCEICIKNQSPDDDCDFVEDTECENY